MLLFCCVAMEMLPASIPGPACLHPAVVLSVSHPGPACFHPWSSLPPSLVLQPLSATRLLPRGFQGALPSLRTLDKTLLEMKRGRGRRGAPAGYSICLCRSLAAAAGARASVQVRFIKPAPASEWRRAETATETRTAGIAACGGSRTMEKAEGGQ